jgi:CTP:molybdopterin cytidylyltransferase MocA
VIATEREDSHADSAPEALGQPVVVLAAGHGTRMGGPKAFAEVNGATFLAHILARAHEAESPVILTVDPRFRSRVDALLATLAPARMRLVEADGLRPMVASVQASFAALDASAIGAWLWPVDAPLLSARGWRHARTAVALRPDAIHKLRTQERTGHPTWFPRWAVAAICAREWDDGLPAFLASVPAERIAVVDLPGEILGDFNTPEQLAALQP